MLASVAWMMRDSRISGRISAQRRQRGKSDLIGPANLFGIRVVQDELRDCRQSILGNLQPQNSRHAARFGVALAWKAAGVLGATDQTGVDAEGAGGGFE